MIAAIYAIGWIANQMAIIAAEPKKPIEVVDFMTGGNSGAAKPEVRLVQDRQAWARAWIHNRQYAVISDNPDSENPDNVPDLPNLDFDKTQVIVVFGGLVKNVGSFRLQGVTLEDHHDVVRLIPEFLQSGTSAVMVTQPFALIQVTKAKRELDVYLQNGTDANGDPVWRQIAKFGKPKPSSGA
jgi:hypothetical protein